MNVDNQTNQRQSQKNKRRVKRVIKATRKLPRTTRITNQQSNDNRLMSRSEVIGKAIQKNIEKAQNYYNEVNESFTPFSKYLHCILHENSPVVPTPLTPGKVFIKTVRYQDTLTVNSSGALAVVLQPAVLGRFENSTQGGTASPFLYMNQTSYDPDATTASGLTGGWTLTPIDEVNVDYTNIDALRVHSMHLTIQMTGVNNYDKKGTIHLAEQSNDRYYYGDSADFTYNEDLVQRFCISRLPKCEKYKSVEIVNMDSASELEYHYFPLSNRDLKAQYISPTINSGSGYATEDTGLFKMFAFIVRGAAAGTTFRFKYEWNLELDVSIDGVNTYPPKYSRCFVDSEPTLCMLNQNVDYSIRTNVKEGHIDKTVYKEIQQSNVSQTLFNNLVEEKSGSKRKPIFITQ